MLEQERTETGLTIERARDLLTRPVAKLTGDEVLESYILADWLQKTGKARMDRLRDLVLAGSEQAEGGKSEDSLWAKASSADVKSSHVKAKVSRSEKATVPTRLVKDKVPEAITTTRRWTAPVDRVWSWLEEALDEEKLEAFEEGFVGFSEEVNYSKLSAVLDEMEHEEAAKILDERTWVKGTERIAGLTILGDWKKTLTKLKAQIAQPKGRK